MSKKVVKWVCDYCSYSSTSKEKVDNHEKICPRNPDTEDTVYTGVDTDWESTPMFGGGQVI